MADQKSYMVYRMAPFSMTLKTSDPFFKVTLYFYAEYPINGVEGSSYYRRWIGNRIQASKWYQF